MNAVLLLRVLERIHGHLGWLAVAALVHPAIVLRNPKRRARLSVGLTTLMVAATWGLGAYVYPEYRARIKQHIFIELPKLGWMFERKEHLAVGVGVFTLVGCIAHLAGPGFDDESTRLLLAKIAHRSFVVACGLAVIVAVLGVAVASYKSF
jgi:hypothetical protein